MVPSCNQEFKSKFEPEPTSDDGDLEGSENPSKYDFVLGFRNFEFKD